MSLLGLVAVLTCLGWFGVGTASAAGTGATIQLQLQPASIAVGGATTTATVTVLDGSMQGVSGDTIQLSSTDAGQTIGAVTDHLDGTYTATITSSDLAGPSTITATDTTSGNISTTAGLTQTPGSAVSIALSPISSVAVGGNTTGSTATVDDQFGNGVPGETVAITTNGGQSISSVADNGDGTYTATITSTNAAGNSTITATDGSLSDTKTLVQTPGPAAGITLSPISAVVVGGNTTSATATVDDQFGNGVPGETVAITSNHSQSISAVTDNGDGTYAATITSTNSAGSSTITAADGSFSATKSLTQTPGPASNVSLQLSPSTLVADGTTTTTATATVTDQFGNPIVGDTISFSGAGGQVGSVTDNGDGTYTGTVKSTTTAGAVTITATDTSVTPNVSGTAQLTQTAGPASNVGVQLVPSTLVADGTATTTATATVTDQFGNPIVGDTISFSGAGGQVGSVTDNGDGTYTGTVKSTTNAGPVTITATDTSVTPNVSGTAQLTQTAGAVSGVGVQLSSSSVVANGSSSVTATATVSDSFGNPVSSQTVVFTSSAPGASPVNGTPGATAGTYTATIPSTTTAGSYTVTATDTSVAPSVSGTAPLTQTPGPPTQIVLGSFTPSTFIASRGTPATATATVKDRFGNGVPGQVLTVTPSDPGDGVSVADIGGGTYVITVTSSATAHLVTVTASAPGTNVASQVLNQVHGPARNLTVSLSSPTIRADGISSVTATMTLTDANGNAVSGDQIKLTSSQPGVRFGAVRSGGNGVYTATVRSSNHPMTLSIIATDTSVSPNVSGEATLTETLARSLLGVATMQWTFAFHPTYTIVALLQLSGAPGGASVKVICHGGGCPFARRTISVSKLAVCKRGHKRHCRPAGPMRLGGLFGSRHLRVGTRVTVEVLRTGWIGKYYSFKVRRAKGPAITISCLAPGGSRPGFGCS